MNTPVTPKFGDQELASVLPAVTWWRSPHLRKVNLFMVILSLFSSPGGFDGSLVNGLQAMPEWVNFMEKPSSTWLGFINAVYWIGALISTPVAAWTCNRYGRRVGVWVGVIFLISGTTMGTAASSANVFTASRAVIGCGMGWVSNAAPILLSEIAYPAHRGVFGALYMVGYYLGAAVAAWVTFATQAYDGPWAWKLPVLLQLLLPLIAVPGLAFIPESPRWLISRGRIEKARRILAELHTGGDTTSPLIAYEVQNIQEIIRAEYNAAASAGSMSVIKSPGNRHRLFITITLGVFAQFSGNGVVSYYLTVILRSVGVTQTRDQLLISACLQVWNVLFAAVGASLVDQIGRRILFITSASIMLTAFILISGLSGAFATSGNGPVGIAVIPFLFIYFLGYDIALTPMFTAYTCEIWPFGLRSRGLSIVWLSAMGCTVFNTFVNPIALSAIHWKYYFVFVAVLIGYWFTAYFFYPETRGYSLEHIAGIFDGKDAKVKQGIEEKTKPMAGPVATESEDVHG
ncbi:hypothetical protein CBS115989_10459 [Aspergillus niger]|nr:general substrate transporter [Aspergillus niger CBS 101883]KAI2812448.1 hypothetical protein CBS115989_10459 [Aspergillus niger]KAI2835985.1 hypothetical protein CBS11232_10311 [Aspergillus niger]KAI2868705.1 hypothetical protein CBS115988_10542 [Aspergillus niger]KAI2871209.1 hypothetical protein CBS11852_11017 [Aspergillus niger]KAI2919676.1 hypothetical protein CBS147320_8430 [Aspergillus niger]